MANDNPTMGLAERFARLVTNWAGSSSAFGIAVLIILVWAVTGPIYDFSNTWQLVINTGTTIVTFLMVFLIQRSQNKDSHAVHLKLNELLAAKKGASNRLISVEDLSEQEAGEFLASTSRALVVSPAKQDDIVDRVALDRGSERESKGERAGRRLSPTSRICWIATPRNGPAATRFLF